MKKYLFIIMAFAFLGCESDDDSNTESNNGNNENANLRATGDSAEELLRATNFDQLEVEFLYVNGTHA